jgi:hypothetical protein
MLNNTSKRVAFFWRRFRAFLGKGWVINKTAIVTTLPANYCRNPIFLIGTHRSGTSLLRRIVDSHVNIACPPESFFLENYASLASNPDVLCGLENLGFNGEQAKQGLAVSSSFFHEAYRLAKNKPRWADKTPQYVFCLDNILGLFGRESQFIFIFRNPLDVAYSIWKRGWSFGRYSDNSLENTCMYVADAISKQVDFLARNRSSCHVVKYEELVDNPAETLTHICAFLHEPWDPNMLTFYDSHHDFGTEDPVVRGTRGFVKSADNWRGWQQEELVVAKRVLADSMLAIGYNPNVVN